MRTLRLAASLLAAVLVAQTAVMVMRPDDPGPVPASVKARDYFTERQLDRARSFRRPQLAIYGATVALELAALLLLVRRPPGWVRRPWKRPVLAGALVGGWVSLVAGLAPLPAEAIGRRRALEVGLTTRSWPGWLADVATSQAIAAVFAALGGALLVFALRRFGRRWWAPGAAAVVLFGVLMTYGSPVLIEPLFNRFTPLPAGETRSTVLELARRARVDVGEVYVIDASKRTTGANAYVAGLGRTKRVVLYDTLLEDFPPAEVRLVVAHELGHVHYADVPHGLLWLVLVAPFGMLAAARLAERLGPSDWRDRPAAAVPAVALALAVVVPVITTISNGLSRDVEARADRFSLELTNQPSTLVAFQRRIALANVSDPDPPAWSTFLLATHPPTLERIGAAVAYERGGSGSAGGGSGGGSGGPSNSGRFLMPSRVRHLE